MRLDSNQILKMIEGNWNADIENCIEDYIENEGHEAFADDFEYAVDGVQLENIEEVDLDSFEVEEQSSENKAIKGVLDVKVYLNGLAYFDKEYHYRDSITADILIEFAILMTNDAPEKFECKCVG